MNIMFANRTRWNLNKNQLALMLENYRKEKIHFLDLTVSNPTQAGIPFPGKEILETFHQTSNLVYHPEPQGMLHARKTVAEYYARKGYELNVAQLFLTASTSEAYAFVFKLMGNPGDEFLIPAPSYPLFDFLAGFNDVVLKPYALEYDGTWLIDRESLEAALSPKTKGILLVNPNNPTGSLIEMNDYQYLVDLCREKKLAIISDEVFWDYVHRKGNYLLSLVDTDEVLCFVLNGISKSLCLPQMKLGWIYVNGPDEYLSEAIVRLELLNDTYLSANTPVQNAIAGLFALQERIQQPVFHRLKANLNMIQNQVTHLPGMSVLDSDAGWYAILKIPPYLDEEELVLELLKEDKILVHPGYFFDFPQNGYLILSLLSKESDIADGIVKIIKRIQEKQKEYEEL